MPKSVFEEDSIKDVASKYFKQISKIREILDSYRNAIKRNDELIGTAWFSSEYLTQPFFVWDNTRYHTSISKLLMGEEIFLKADVMSSDISYDAIKFQKFKLELKVKNKETQDTINNILQKFSLVMSHTGDSRYRFDNTIYSINTTAIQFRYSFQMTPTGTPVSQNLAYEKLSDGDFMLSPYATWKVKLVSKNKSEYEKLQKYKADVNLELSGKGFFVYSDDVERLKPGSHLRLFRAFPPTRHMISI